MNDFAGVIDAASKAQLDTLIRKLQDATGDVMVVATVKTFQPYGDIQSYAVKMFQNHGNGIGTKGKDNGALILLALDDRQVRIETGYGLEGFITDGFAGETSRSMAPFFRTRRLRPRTCGRRHARGQADRGRPQCESRPGSAAATGDATPKQCRRISHRLLDHPVDHLLQHDWHGRRGARGADG